MPTGVGLGGRREGAAEEAGGNDEGSLLTNSHLMSDLLCNNLVWDCSPNGPESVLIDKPALHSS